jgi:hypothetical protein
MYVLYLKNGTIEEEMIGVMAIGATTTSNETKYICLIALSPDFMTKIGKKAAQDFFCAVSKVFDRVKTVALLSVNYHNKYLICDKSRLLRPPSCFSGYYQ